ncbi:hypothetical protein DH2020_029283 [Rehmannia glutinosa]|uniref:Uncharacterized protein n=1 Tax=Rehmannia glutinosa TaxID=99300 RepID=A0ABR0VPS8_REHGL
MNNTMSFQDQDTKTQKELDDEEEALSFCDFPLNPNEPAEKNNSYSKTQSSDLFEFFFNDLKSKNIANAEDIISCGKLVPYKQQPLPPDDDDLVHDQILKSISGDYDAINSSRRSCESLPELNPTRSNSSSRLTSLDSRKLRRNYSSMVVVKSQNSDIERSSSKGSTKSEGIKVLKPRWYALIFGNLVKFPPEIDLRDMKKRQIRRNTGSMFPANRRSSWGHDLLRVLSCKNHASVTVTAS